MSKFYGEMTKEEFIDALKIIINSKINQENKEAKQNRTILEHLQSFYKDMIQDIINFIKFIDSLRISNIIKNYKNFISEPLTKEVFIRRGKRVKYVLWDILDTIIFVVVMVIIIRFCVGEIRWIPSGSMKPTLIEGDRIFVERYTRFYKTPERGDIMVFYPPMTELKNTPWKMFSRYTGFFCKDIAYIKRVIGLPGEKFEIKQDKNGMSTVYINDKPLEEPYVKSVYEYSTCTEAMNCGPFTIPEGEYFMMGDNRGNSQDSRYWGTLPVNRFIGRATYLFWPTNRKKSLILRKF